jgi:5S rRNA maturation endonuclease (ribonuclease M5)
MMPLAIIGVLILAGLVGVWGLESYYLSDTLFITEGVFDAARISYFGYAAVATLSNDIGASTANWLSTVRSSRLVVAICDNDAGGRRLAKYGYTSHVVSGYKDLVTHLELCKPINRRVY